MRFRSVLLRSSVDDYYEDFPTRIRAIFEETNRAMLRRAVWNVLNGFRYRNWLVQFFGEDRVLIDITDGCAKDWRGCNALADREHFVSHETIIKVIELVRAASGNSALLLTVSVGSALRAKPFL